jgi:2,4-dienoyl-CoA reductase-like NADH-dependent reductase (Old Yellow Enzyme family)
LNLIKKTREKVGRDFLIGFRISGEEHIEGGFNLEDAKKIVKILEKVDRNIKKGYK